MNASFLLTALLADSGMGCGSSKSIEHHKSKGFEISSDEDTDTTYITEDHKSGARRALGKTQMKQKDKNNRNG
ncbi:hypothetical protein ElyMa_004359900 [Elysia marginata]|uniref:Secreted protein n=1 Tax=Elysia marginata TaxID=1093978 RepID=A0AAV4H613_9GAST|nr:hypothetical protein ElyMa_004359900 [Elysia marginata]